MKKLAVLLLVSILILAPACQVQPTASSSEPTSNPSSTVNPPSNPSGDPGSDTSRYPQSGGNGSEQYGPKGEEVPKMSDGDKKVYLKAQGAIGDGIADDTEAFEQAISKAADGFVLIEKGVYRLAGNVTVPSNVTLVFAGGAVLAPDKKITLKITGFVDAGIQQIFSGKGTVEGIIRNAGYPQWFGPVGTDDDSLSFQGAFDALQEVIVPGYVQYNVSNLKIYHPLSVSGQGVTQVQLNLRKGGKRLFDIRSSDVCIERFKVAGNKDENSTIIYFNTAEGDLKRITVSSIWAQNTGYFLRDAETNGEHTVCDTNLLDLRVDAARSIAYHLTDFRSGIRLNCVQRQNLGVQFAVDQPGMLFCNIEDMYMADIDVTGGSGQECKGSALVFKNCTNVTLDRAMMEAVNGYNFYAENCSGFSINHWVGGEYNDTSLRLIDCENMEFNLMLLIGNNYPGTTFPSDLYSPDAAHLTNCRNITFNGLNIQRFFGNGMIVEDSTGVVVNTLVGWTNCGTTFEERGTSDHNVINGLTVGECEGKSVVLKGSSSKVFGATLNDGTFEEEIVGPCER